jgi:tripartite-type tricarboxylate transporter receptor subunit TctC
MPAGTPAAIMDRLSSEVGKALAQTDVREKIVAQGMTLVGSSPAEMRSALKTQYELYRRLIQDNNIKAE